jgi:hypothetical protein
MRLEGLGVPLIVRGPGVENISLGGVWSQENISPTILGLLGIAQNISASNVEMPLKKSHSLKVIGANDEVAVYREEKLLANASAEEIMFKGLNRGIYTIRCGLWLKKSASTKAKR